ncbi:MAG: hypothetical protein E4G96_07620, partial [Chrysiogenales bacterium]
MRRIFRPYGGGECALPFQGVTAINLRSNKDMNGDDKNRDQKPRKKWVSPGGSPGQQKPSRSMALWVMVIILFFLAFLLFNSSKEREWPIDYSQFIAEVDNGNIASVKIKG